ncbi:DUF2190 family protein [Pseudooceanicola sp. CBS1P-1]|uniref:DUF2190 family protein n=1 Tax=Pseudooceanicola albus TaxID=2692189 RepID=A0A6L7G3M7_9RHOB|nr:MULTISPECIES: DUF2190 family protein [Pseudooceanicola]MBT9385626.1 DUF2190 family protein [Pseudooceanicola endophyticus]MXN18964.1 DUF2190 family protein [Pseudooceanicola albus]
MQNYIQKGDTITFTSAEAVASGQGVLMGALFGIASTSAAAGAPFEAALSGVYDLPKAADAIAAGDRLYWAVDADVVTTTAEGNTLIGAATEAAADAAAYVRVRLNGVA